MMRFVRLFFFFALCGWTTLSAQVADSTAIRFGIGGSFLLNQHRANFDTIPGIASCCRQQYGGAASQGFGISAFAEYPVVKLTDFATFSVGGRVSYFSGLGARLTAQEKIQVQMATATIQHELAMTMTSLTLEPMAVLRLLKWLTVSAGFQLGTYLQRNYQYQERILEPSDLTYSNGATVFNGASGAIPNVSALQLALVGGISYELPINREGTVLPTLEAYYTYPLTSPVNGVDWRIASLRLGASLRFSPYRTTDQTPQEIEQRYQENIRFSQEIARKAIAEAKEARKKELTAKISELRSVSFDDLETVPGDSSARNVGGKLDVRLSAENFTIRMSKIPLVQHIALLPMVFFGENSSVIPTRYKQFPNVSEASSFTSESSVSGANATLTAKATLSVYYHLLNILAKRLQAAPPDATLKLTGTALETEQNPTRLAEARANAVSTYLQDVWRIPSQRMVIAQRVVPPSAQADELRAVEISSSMPEVLLRPMEVNAVKRTVSPQGLQLGLQIAAGQGLKQWDLEISQITAREALTLHSTQGGATYPQQYVWDIRTNPPVSGEDVSIKLSIDDVTNNKIEAPIIAIKVVEEPSKVRMESFTLLPNAESNVVKSLRASITPESRIVGRFSENDSFLKSLALQGLQTRQLPKPLFDSNTPEGRFYNRGASVEVTK
jgi:hypothetical protein